MNIIETNLKFNSNMSERKLTRRAIFHNSGTTVRQSIETLHNYHKNTRAYAGIGYHLYVRRDGTIYRGRPENMQGAHAYGANSDSIGICFEGNFNEEEMTLEQIEAGKEIVQYLRSKYRNIEFTEHKKVCNTSCPGKNFRFNEITEGKIENEQVIQKPADENEHTNVFSDGKINCIFDIQEYLNKHYNANLVLDNVFGAKTKSVLIKALQIELNRQYGRGLAEDGIFGIKTYNACPAVKNGAFGRITYLIQMALFIKGYTINIDGKFGKETQRIVKQYQSENGLTVDGIVGKNTLKKLF